MEILFYLSAIVYACSIICKYKRDKQIITIPNIIFFSTIVNFILYLQKWSLDFNVECSDSTFYIMIVISIIFSAYALIYRKKKTNYNFYLKKLCLGSWKIQVSTILISICIIFIALENYYYSGSFFSADKLSHHTANMPIIGTILKGLYPIAYICSYNDWKTYKHKSTIIYAIFCFLYALFGLGSRYWATVSIMTTVFFVVGLKEISLNYISKKIKIMIFIFSSILLYIFIYIGNLRVAEGFSYGYSIRYVGPLNEGILSDLFSWYYGYFPYSFHNLNITIMNIDRNNIVTFGQFLSYPYLAFLHLHHFFELYLDDITYSVRVFDNLAATIATGWFEFYSDFREFFFIGVLVFLFITMYFDNINNFYGRVSYAAMLTVWALMSFLNTYTLGTVLYTFIIAYIIQSLFVVRIRGDRSFES